MKRVYIIFSVIAALAFTFAACNKVQENPYEYKLKNPAIVVTSGKDLNLEAIGGTKTIKFSNVVKSAECEDGWLTVSFKDSTVSVTAEMNSAIISRSSVVKVSEPGGEYVNVPVMQYGGIVKIDLDSYDLNLPDKAQKFTYDVKATLPVTISTTADWLKASISPTTLEIEVAENASGRPRSGAVELDVVGNKTTINVTQMEFAKDIAGDYLLYYATSGTGAISAAQPITISKTGITFTNYGLTWPIALDEAAAAATLSVPADLGKAGSYYVNGVFRYTRLKDDGTTGAYWTNLSSASMTLKYLFEEYAPDSEEYKEYGVKSATFFLVDDWTIADALCYAIAFRAYTDEARTSSPGYLLSMYNFIIERDDEVASPK